MPELLKQGKLDRTVRVIRRADELCPTQEAESATVLASTLLELHEGAGDARAQIEAGLVASRGGRTAEAQRLFDQGRTELERAEGAPMTVEAREELATVTAWPRADVLAQRADDHLSMFLVSSLEERLRFDGASGPLVFSPDGSKLASGSAREEVALLFDAVSGRELAKLPGHALGLDSMHFNADGTKLETRARDGVSFVWDAATGKELSRAPRSKAARKRAALSGTKAPAALKYWTDPSAPFGPNEVVCGVDGKRCPDSGPASIVYSLDSQSSPDGSKVATEWRRDLPGCVWQCPTESLVVLTDAASGKELERLYPCGVPVFSADGAAIVSTGGGGFGDPKLRLWSVATGKLLLELEVTSWAFSPDGTRIAVSIPIHDAHSAKTRIDVYRTADGTLLSAPADEQATNPRFVLTPEGYVDFAEEATRHALVCRLKQYVFPFEVCEEGRRVPGLLDKVLSGNTTFEP